MCPIRMTRMEVTWVKRNGCRLKVASCHSHPLLAGDNPVAEVFLQCCPACCGQVMWPSALTVPLMAWIKEGDQASAPRPPSIGSIILTFVFNSQPGHRADVLSLDQRALSRDCQRPATCWVCFHCWLTPNFPLPRGPRGWQSLEIIELASEVVVESTLLPKLLHPVSNMIWFPWGPFWLDGWVSDWGVLVFYMSASAWGHLHGKKLTYSTLPSPRRSLPLEVLVKVLPFVNEEYVPFGSLLFTVKCKANLPSYEPVRFEDTTQVSLNTSTISMALPVPKALEANPLRVKHICCE